MLRAGFALGVTPAPARARVARDAFTTSDRVRLSYWRAGPRAGATPVVFVPGWCVPASIWQPNLIAAAADRPALALDPRGQGESEVPSQGYTADRRARDLHELLAGLRQPAVVVAWSLAGLEALQMTHRFGTRRLQALVLVDSSVGEGPAGDGSGTERFRQQLRQDREAALTGFARAIFRSPRGEADTAALVASMQRMPLQASLDLLDYGLPREHWRRLARGFDRPLLYVVTPQYREQARLLAAARPATRTQVFESAGHALFADEPQRFDRVLHDFLGSA